MYRLLLLCVLFLLLFCNFQTNALILLYAGTPVSLRLNEEVQSEAVEVGTVVELLVRNDVVVNGKVLIQTGSPAEGTVTEVHKFCSDCARNCPKITLEVESVQAVDGQQIYLRGLPHTVQQACGTYESATAKIGAVLKARVLNNVRVRA